MADDPKTGRKTLIVTKTFNIDTPQLRRAMASQILLAAIPLWLVVCLCFWGISVSFDRVVDRNALQPFVLTTSVIYPLIVGAFISLTYGRAYRSVIKAIRQVPGRDLCTALFGDKYLEIETEAGSMSRTPYTMLAKVAPGADGIFIWTNSVMAIWIPAAAFESTADFAEAKQIMLNARPVAANDKPRGF